MFTNQRNVRPGFLPFGGLHYHEFIEIIPYVEHESLSAPGGGPFLYMPYMILDEWLAVLVGQHLYGFSKRLGRIATNSLGFDVRSDLGQIRAQFGDRSLLGGVDDIPGIRDFCRLVDHPFIAQTSTGRWVYSYLDYRLDTAEFREIDGYIQIGEPFLPDRASDPASTRAHRSKAKQGEYMRLDDYYPWLRFTTRWTLSIPLPSEDTLGAIIPRDLRGWLPSLPR
jgi:hypothetical protein